MDVEYSSILVNQGYQARPVALVIVSQSIVLSQSCMQSNSENVPHQYPSDSGSPQSLTFSKWWHH